MSETNLILGLWCHYLMDTNANGTRGLINNKLWCDKDFIKKKITIIKKEMNNNVKQKNWHDICSLKELQEALEALEHPLHITSNNTVFSSFKQLEVVNKGILSIDNVDENMDKMPNIMVIGEAPGEEEDKTGFPFVGASGQLLEQIFESIGLSRKKNIYISNVLPWRPPANRTPTDEEVEFFLPYLIQHVKIIKPKLLILVGGTAYKALFKQETTYKNNVPISKIRGQFIKHNLLGIMCYVVFHPSYLLRASAAKKIMWHDMLELQDYLSENFSDNASDNASIK